MDTEVLTSPEALPEEQPPVEKQRESDSGKLHRELLNIFFELSDWSSEKTTEFDAKMREMPNKIGSNLLYLYPGIDRSLTSKEQDKWQGGEQHHAGQYLANPHRSNWFTKMLLPSQTLLFQIQKQTGDEMGQKLFDEGETLTKEVAHFVTHRQPTPESLINDAALFGVNVLLYVDRLGLGHGGDIRIEEKTVGSEKHPIVTVTGEYLVYTDDSESPPKKRVFVQQDEQRLIRDRYRDFTDHRQQMKPVRARFEINLRTGEIRELKTITVAQAAA